MDAVKAFNNELASLYESKPPVSKAKMDSITKSAIKAVKFYKHVVQSVEKFILKCRAEYKVPGLYVIDSIVRRSRHHFGVEKDMFAQRFAKNIVATFQNLCSCPPDEKTKIIRVLQLWQKNGVFSQEVIQQLTNMVEQTDAGPSGGPASADESFGDNQNSQQSDTSGGVEASASMMEIDSRPSSREVEGVGPHVGNFSAINDMNASVPEPPQHPSDAGAGADLQTNVLSAVVQLLQSQQPIKQLIQHQLLQQLPPQLLQPGTQIPQQLLQQLTSVPQQQQQQPVSSSLSQPPSLMSQPSISSAQPIHQLSQLQPPLPPQPPHQDESYPLPGAFALHLDRRSEENSQESEPRFNKNLLEFDYGESDEEDGRRQTGRSFQLDDDKMQPVSFKPPTFGDQSPPPPNHQMHRQMNERDEMSSFFMTHGVQNIPRHLEQQQEELEQQLLMDQQRLQQLDQQRLQQLEQQRQQQLDQQRLQQLDQQRQQQLDEQRQLDQQRQQQLDQQRQQFHLHQQLHPSQAMSQPDDRMERIDYFHGKQPDWPADNENNFRERYGGAFGSQQNSWHQEQNDSAYSSTEQAFDQVFQQDFDDNGQSRDRNRPRDQEDRKRRRSRDRSPRRHGQSRNGRDSSRRSRSRDRRRRSRDRDRSHRSRSQSRDRMKERERRDKDREKREKDRERRSCGLPPLEENHMSVCSTTLWIGHLSKHTKESELKEEMATYGELTSFNLIPPRGCAYVSFSSRKDASRALEKLKGSKLLGNVLKVDWAMGVGLKQSEFKDLWDKAQGVSYIPWDRIPENLDAIAEGGFVDEDSLPEEVKNSIKEKAKEKENLAATSNSQIDSAVTLQSADPVGANQASTSNNVFAVAPPLPTAPLPSGILPPMMPPPPGFLPPMMMPGGVTPMMRMPPPLMPGMMPPPMATLPPSLRPALPTSNPASEASVVPEGNKGLDAAPTSSSLDSTPPIPMPGPPRFGWPHPLNMRPGGMPFRPPMPPFVPPGAFGRMPFPPSAQPFQGSGEPRPDVEQSEEDNTESAMNKSAENAEGSNDHMELEPGVPRSPGVPPPPGVPPSPGVPLPPPRGWAPPGMNNLPGGPRPDLMGPRLRPPFGPRGFAGPVPPLMPPRMVGREDNDNENIQDGGEMEMQLRNNDEEPEFSGPDGPNFRQNFGGQVRGNRPPWFDFHGGPPNQGPRGLRAPGHPRFQFEERGRGLGRPPFWPRGPPGFMGEETRFNGPPMGFRGRPPFPPRGPGFPNVRGPHMEPPFGRPPFRGPRPLFPRNMGAPGEGSEFFDETHEGGPDSEDNWNDAERNSEEPWNQEEAHRDERRPPGRRPDHWQGEEGEPEGGWNQWGGENRGNWRHGSSRRQSVDGNPWEQNRRKERDDGNADEHWAREERKQPKSAWGEFFDSNTGEVVGLGGEALEQPVVEKSEKKPRKSRWSSIEPSGDQAAPLEMGNDGAGDHPASSEQCVESVAESGQCAMDIAENSSDKSAGNE